MDGKDKATALLGGRRLVDLVLERLTPQSSLIVISGPSNYGTGFKTILDAPRGPNGPVAGVFAVGRWLERQPSGDGFVTAPIDGPFLPADFVERICAAGVPAIAVDDAGAHPTFAYWTLAALNRAWRDLKGEESVSLRRLAEACASREVSWPGTRGFCNINTPQDLEAASSAVGDIFNPA